MMTQNQISKAKTRLISAKNIMLVIKKLNDAWQNLNKETRKSLLPAQRQWIKSKSTCNGNWECLTNMTNERILELEAENGK